MQDVSVFSILWFCILITSFLLFIFLTACGECSCCCRKASTKYQEEDREKMGGYRGWQQDRSTISNN